jgi:hypothetical protein
MSSGVDYFVPNCRTKFTGYATCAVGRNVRAAKLPIIRSSQQLQGIRSECTHHSFCRERFVIEDGKAQAQDLNRMSWYAIFGGTVAPSDVEDALKGSQINEEDTSMLHTLGCVYAEVGKTIEAHDVLIQSMNIEHLDEPDSKYWYAFGRVAEQSGERGAALADYARVTRPEREEDVRQSSYYLAQRRLKILQSEKH